MAISGRFNVRQKAFILAYSRAPYPSRVEAYQLAFGVRKAKSAENSAWRLLHANGGAAQKEVERLRRLGDELALFDLNISAVRILQELAKIAFDEGKGAERLKALELLMKRQGMFAVEKHDITSGGRPIEMGMTDGQILQRVAEIAALARQRRDVDGGAASLPHA